MEENPYQPSGDEPASESPHLVSRKSVLWRGSIILAGIGWGTGVGVGISFLLAFLVGLQEVGPNGDAYMGLAMLQILVFFGSLFISIPACIGAVLFFIVWRTAKTRRTTN